MPATGPRRAWTCAQNGALLGENFKESDAGPTFKKPLKPPPLLFDLFAQSESARHERFCGVRKKL
jgi:hypothetical protein